jgi:hypothetical protein
MKTIIIVTNPKHSNPPKPKVPPTPPKPAKLPTVLIYWNREKLKAAPVQLGPPPTRNRQTFPFHSTIDFQGLKIRVETPKGGTRSGVDSDGKPWSVVMPAHYGEFARTLGADGDPIDAFVGPDAHAPFAYVVHIQDPTTKEYDEDKVLLGFQNRDAALAAFSSAYTRPGFRAGVRKLSIGELRDWLRDKELRGLRITAGEELTKGRPTAPSLPESTGLVLPEHLAWV